LALVVIDNYKNLQHKTLCIFKLATGIPCPGCGMGRASLSLLKGEIVSSFHYNILCIPFTLTLIISIVWMIKDVVKKQETFFKFIGQKISLKYKLLLFGLIFIDWIFNIIRGI
jgi:hypothetical protein